MPERAALYGMLADNADNIVVKSDPRGFIVSASPALAGLGANLRDLLFGPHLSDLARSDRAEALAVRHRATFAGHGNGQWHEFPSSTGGWFEIRMQRLCESGGQAYGVLSVLRSVTERKSLEERLFVAELTDPLTRLTNRIAFTAMLEYLIANKAAGCLALFDLDHFMTHNITYGQAAADDLLRAFADLLRNASRREDIISRLGAERFAVLLPQCGTEAARDLCQGVIEMLADMNHETRGHALSASCGVAPITGSVDQTVRRAEFALFLAKAKGRSRVEISRDDAGHASPPQKAALSPAPQCDQARRSQLGSLSQGAW
ncbi:MAG: GGDEF domain-containing protein [Proteobacteria bacterium]|nr:GGDEF domain-containing protein [Pseudomonadota bacterium]